MSPERIAELRALAEEATPGPWTLSEIGGGNQIVRGMMVAENYFCLRDIAMVHVPVADQRSKEDGPDAAFIAAARTALPEALSEIERLTKLAEAEAALHEANPSPERSV